MKVDDYLLNHSIDELKKLPVEEYKSLEVRVNEANRENYASLLKEIACVADRLEKELMIKDLAERLGVSITTVKNSLKPFYKETQEKSIDRNIVIAHPAYEVNEDFLSLGFREKVIIDDAPQDRNFYLIGKEEGFSVHEGDSVFTLGDKKIIFDIRDRLLIQVNEKWNKDILLDFAKNPKSPERLFVEIKETLKHFIEFQKDAHYGLIAAWIIATYFHRFFNAFPFLFFYGKKQSGKSRSLDLLERVAFNAMKIKGISTASMSDSIDGVRGTFCNDQAESLSDKKNLEILGFLADSYTSGGGRRRIVSITNKSRKIIEFETYSPKAFAATKEIDSDLKDRCILVPMLRAKREYPYPEPHLPVWPQLRDKLYRLLLTKCREVKNIYSAAGIGVKQRIKELWKPIETILLLEKVSSEEREDIKKAFLESMLETQAELSDKEHELIDAIINLLEGSEENQELILSINEIAAALNTTEEINPKGMQTWTGKKIGELSLYVRPAPRKNRKRAYVFTKAHIKDVLNRFSETSGSGGDVVPKQENTYDSGYHILNSEISEVVGNTTLQPPIRNEVVAPIHLNDKDLDHLTTKTTENKKQPAESSVDLLGGEI